MGWLLPWLLAAATLWSGVMQAVVGNRGTPAPIPGPTASPSPRPQYCKWPCECPAVAPRCAPGISLVTDGCECCPVCAQQLGAPCNEAALCDRHRGLYCDYSADAPRYEIGVCAHVVGVGCVLDGVRYRNGQSFQPNCKYNCTCLNGAVGCVPLCLGSRPPLVWCPQPRRVRLAGRCCDQWVCDDGKKLRRASPRHVPAPAYEGDGGLWQHNCMPHTSPWSLCSRSCGMGISTRISNANERCQLTTESRLCNLRPCQGGIARHIKPGKKCLAVHRPEEPRNFTISGCVSRDTYRPKFCGVCTDGRCCTPYKSKTINVSFVCPDGPGFSWKVMWINACFCHLSCKNPNDIFADLEHYHDYSEIAD
ncbi:CCN family member 4 isoform X1 [Tachyglossus aculeatus]|uniref:CCN family member 4 isoform X1 n=1 Tax=Tachyglossus aculeatus TaxID=9261 RepID=UPI0018F3623D|nr:CCN family member 4 isoform X1 [Tachyglossus aculeatus]